MASPLETDEELVAAVGIENCKFDVNEGVSSDEDSVLEEQEISQLLARRLDALIIASCHSSVELFARIEKQNTPYILIDRTLPD